MNILELKHKSTNIYLISIPGGWLMFDAGWPDTAPVLFNLFKKNNIRLEDIRYMIISHFHLDHAGLAQDLKNKGVKLILVKDQVPFVLLLNEYMKKKPDLHFTPICTEGNIIISSAESRDLLKSLGLKGEIILTPGHSDDSITLVIEGEGAFTGDLTHPDMLEAYNDPVLNQSWKQIRDRGVRIIYPAHGEKYNLKMD